MYYFWSSPTTLLTLKNPNFSDEAADTERECYLPKMHSNTYSKQVWPSLWPREEEYTLPTMRPWQEGGYITQLQESEDLWPWNNSIYHNDRVKANEIQFLDFYLSSPRSKPYFPWYYGEISLWNGTTTQSKNEATPEKGEHISEA